MILGILKVAGVFVWYRYQGCTADGNSWNPMDDKVVTISRATGTLTLPTNFMLVAAPPKYGGTQAAMNPAIAATSVIG